MSVFSDNLKEARLKAGLTRKDMASKLNISVVAYGNYETGEREPKLANLVAIADILNISIDKLIGHEFNEYEYYKKVVESIKAPFIYDEAMIQGYEVIENEQGINVRSYWVSDNVGFDSDPPLGNCIFNDRADFCNNIKEALNYTKIPVNNAKNYWLNDWFVRRNLGFCLLEHKPYGEKK